jgi:hypothetical protein
MSIPYEQFRRLLEKTLKEDKELYDMLAHVEREELFELVFEKLKAVSVDTRLVEETDPESGSTSLYIVTRKRRMFPGRTTIKLFSIFWKTFVRTTA